MLSGIYSVILSGIYLPSIQFWHFVWHVCKLSYLHVDRNGVKRMPTELINSDIHPDNVILTFSFCHSIWHSLRHVFGSRPGQSTKMPVRSRPVPQHARDMGFGRRGGPQDPKLADWKEETKEIEEGESEKEGRKAGCPSGWNLETLTRQVGNKNLSRRYETNKYWDWKCETNGK